ncbi:MAG TPA: formylglycine-generating enzyme family protein [Polyangiaceae bacterium]|nr:formylglycine-generating enzyme family protein [Polyangiaceae bacterium]
MSNCGASSESCCTSLEVPGGTYYRTYPDTSDEQTSEADPASVSGFRMDKYLVTVGRFRQFVIAWSNGAGYLPAAGTGKHVHLNGGSGLVSAGAVAGGGVVYESGWDATDWNNTVDIDPVNGNLDCGAFWAWTGTAGNQETLPIDCVNWFEAYAFCIWDGGFLPSEAEWEFVAAGGSAQLAYPWGSTIPGGTGCPGASCCPGPGCQLAIYDCFFPSGTSSSCTGVTNIAPVGTATMGAGRWGQLDMAGEMSEWNLDWYAASYVDPCTDCAYLTTASYREFRGGSFYDGEEFLEPPTRDDNGPGLRDNGVGFRCARTP